MKQRKLVFSIVLCFSTVVFAAPKNEGNINKIKPKETVTIPVYSAVKNASVYPDLVTLQSEKTARELLEKFNVKLSYTEEKDYSGFVIIDTATPEYEAACKENLLLDFEKENLIYSWGPLLLQNYKRPLQKNKFIDSPNKAMYGFATDAAESVFEPLPCKYYWSLQTDLYEQLEKPEVKSLFDLVELLGKMQEACPQNADGKKNYGVSLFADVTNGKITFISELIAAYYGYEDFDTGYYDPKTGKIFQCLDADGPYLNCIKFLNKLSQKDLIAPSAQKQSFAQSKKDFANGTVFWSIFAENSQVSQVLPKDAKPLVHCKSVYGGNTIWAIGANALNPQICMAVLNWVTQKQEVSQPDKATPTPDLQHYSLSPVSLFAKIPAPEEYTENWPKISELIITESWKAIYAENDKMYEEIITKLQESIKETEYEECCKYSQKNASFRFTAEKMTREEK